MIIKVFPVLHDVLYPERDRRETLAYIRGKDLVQDEDAISTHFRWNLRFNLTNYVEYRTPIGLIMVPADIVEFNSCVELENAVLHAHLLNGQITLSMLSEDNSSIPLTGTSISEVHYFIRKPSQLVDKRTVTSLVDGFPHTAVIPNTMSALVSVTANGTLDETSINFNFEHVSSLAVKTSEGKIVSSPSDVKFTAAVGRNSLLMTAVDTEVTLSDEKLIQKLQSVF